MIYYSSLIEYFIVGMITFIISILLCVFSPFGIFFILFSIIRVKTKNQTLRIISLVFQNISAGLTLIIGFVIALLSSMNHYSDGGIIMLAAIIGVCFVFAIEFGVIIWETIWLNYLIKK